MLRSMLKSKIHRATVTEANLQYQGSITIDADLPKAADLIPGEQVQVVRRPVLILLACWVGKTRLIDNVRAVPRGS